MQPKRSRGRPLGSTSYKIDGTYLDAVADLIVRGPKLKKTRAIIIIVQKALQEHNWKAATRRLLRKWDQTGSDRLEAAARRREEEQNTSVIRHLVPSRTTFSGTYNPISEALAVLSLQSDAKKIQDWVDASAKQSKLLHDACLKMSQVAIDPPHVHQMREFIERQRKLTEIALGQFGLRQFLPESI